MQTNDSSEVVVKQFSQYTGLAKFKVVGINPTKEELETLGYQPKDEPKYEVTFKDKDTQEDVNRFKVSFYLAGKNMVVNVKGETEEVEIKTRIEFLMGKDFQLAKTGKHKIVNRLGQFSWADSVEVVRANEKMKWFMHEPIRQAYIGEEELLSFVREWMNLANDADGCLETIVNIINGDLSELKQLQTTRPNNEVIVLLGVKEDGEKSYQNVYPKCYSRPTAKNPAKKFSTALNAEYGEFKANWGNSFDLKEFNSVATVDKPDASSTATITSDFS